MCISHAHIQTKEPRRADTNDERRVRNSEPSHFERILRSDPRSANLCVLHGVRHRLGLEDRIGYQLCMPKGRRLDSSGLLVHFLVVWSARY